MTVAIINIPCSILSISIAMEKITAFGNEIGLDKSTCFETKVVIAEALNNIVSHAQPRVTTHSITIHCEFLEQGTLEIIIQDQGQAFSPHAREYFPAGLCEGGRGCSIISGWTDSVEYKRQNGLNTLILKKHFTKISRSD